MAKKAKAAKVLKVPEIVVHVDDVQDGYFGSASPLNELMKFASDFADAEYVVFQAVRIIRKTTPPTPESTFDVATTPLQIS